jgi:AraC-like DNA-binding protein
MDNRVRRLDFLSQKLRSIDSPDEWAAFAHPSGTIRARGLSCLGAGEHLGVTLACRDRRLPSHGAVVISSGRGFFADENGVTASIDAPSVIWLFPGVAHGYGPDSGGWDEHWVLFSGVGATLYQELQLIEPGRPVTRLSNLPPELGHMFGELRTQLSAVGIRHELHASALTQQVLAGLSTQSRPRDEDPVFLRGLTVSADLPIPVAERARRLGISPQSLRRQVKSRSGLSPVAYDTQTRLSRAQELLADSEMSVQEVARTVGYTDPAYFSRVFRRMVGMPPSTFRRQQARQVMEMPATIIDAAAHAASEEPL